MNDGHVTLSSIKKINRNKVYRTIYDEKTTSKYQLVQLLDMGLSTVSSNLSVLRTEKLIEFDGFFESTGGRRANQIRIIPDARIALGIGILHDRLHFVAADLYGKMIHKNTWMIQYAHDESYYRKLGDYLRTFIDENEIDSSKILGVSIATQGIVSRDGSHVDYGTLMRNFHMKLSDLKPYIPFPCRMEHDSKAAANLVLWNHRDIKNGVLFLLNENLGSAVIVNRIVHWGDHMHSGLIEHICMDPDGPLCYCGQKGCLDTYCSAQRLEHDSGMDIASFFSVMRKTGAPELRVIWEDFLSRLAFAIRNLSVTIDGVFVLSGYLAPFITKEDTDDLLEMINAHTPWALTEDQLRLGESGQFTPALGAALHYISDFLDSV